MKKITILALLVPAWACSFSQTGEFKQVSLNDMSAFRPNAGNWFVVSKMTMDPPWNTAAPAVPAEASPKKKRRSRKQASAPEPEKPKTIVYEEGTGVLLNMNSREKRGDLVTTWEHGDIELELEVMIPPGSNSGIYLQGAYEVQLFDSWGVRNPQFSDIGGIYRNWDTTAEGRYMGKAPMVNACRAPGLWQTIKISFRAPRFDDQGQKISNAKFIFVDLNGVRIHENVEVPHMTGGPLALKESPRGPLMIQGDHGNVAIRNIRYKLLDDNTPPAPVFPSRTIAPVLVKVGNETKLLRAFLDFKGDRSRRLTHTIAVGDPDGVHYIYNLKAGNIACVWRGDFIDATPMWYSRGDGSYRPMGMVQYLSASPALAELPDANARFPDSLDAKDFRSNGYTFKERPVFNYTYKGVEVYDKIIPDPDGKMLTREVSFKDSTVPAMYFRLAAGSEITGSPDRYFTVDDRKYYIHILSGQQEIIRQTPEGKELLVSTDGKPIIYSIIW